MIAIKHTENNTKFQKSRKNESVSLIK